MSWRTKGQYQGLGSAERDWLRSFDRVWDTKSSDRFRADALDRPRSQRALTLISAPPREELYVLEVQLAQVAHRIRQFTVPRSGSRGWTIYLVLDGGKKCRACFTQKDHALQAYLTLQELSVMILMG